MPHENDNLAINKIDSWKIFDAISPSYDLLNRLLSLGLDRHWRRQLKKFLPRRSDQRLLDLATGTADVLLILVRHGRYVAEATGIDLAEKMLAIGRKKVARAGLSDKISLVAADARHIPFDANKFDAVTMAFGIRNVEDPLQVLREMHRVLTKGGRALILEFSLPENRALRALHLRYLRKVVPAVGGLISGHSEAYRYLNRTIEQFPYGGAFCAIMQDAGFSNPKAHLLLGGIATIYVGEKL